MLLCYGVCTSSGWVGACLQCRVVAIEAVVVVVVVVIVKEEVEVVVLVFGSGDDS